MYFHPSWSLSNKEFEPCAGAVPGLDRGLFNELDLYNQTGLGIILHMPIVFLSTKIGQIEALIKNGAVAGVLIGDNSENADILTDS